MIEAEQMYKAYGKYRVVWKKNSIKCQSLYISFLNTVIANYAVYVYRYLFLMAFWLPYDQVHLFTALLVLLLFLVTLTLCSSLPCYDTALISHISIAIYSVNNGCVYWYMNQHCMIYYLSTAQRAHFLIYTRLFRDKLFSHACTHARMHARTHARTHANAHTHMYICLSMRLAGPNAHVQYMYYVRHECL